MEEQLSTYLANVTILTSENPDPEAFAQARAYLINIERIPILFYMFNQDNNNHQQFLFAQRILNEIINSPDDLFPNKATFRKILYSSAERYTQFIGECFQLIRKSYEHIEYFSEIVLIKIMTHQFPEQNMQIFAEFIQILDELMSQVTPTSTGQLVEVAGKLYLYILSKTFFLVPDDQHVDIYNHFQNLLLVSYQQLKNLYIVSLFVDGYVQTYMDGASLAFEDGQYGSCLLELMSSPEALQALSSNPYFFYFLDKNSVFLSEYVKGQIEKIQSNKATLEIEPFALKVLLPFASVIPSFCKILFENSPQHPQVFSIAQNLMAIYDHGFAILQEYGFFNDPDLFPAVVQLAYSLSIPTADDLEEYDTNIRNYYISIFLDAGTVFNQSISIIYQIFKNLSPDHILPTLELILSNDNENTIFIIANLLMLLNDIKEENKTSTFYAMVNESPELFATIKTFVRKTLHETYDKVQPRYQLTILWMIMRGMFLLEEEDYEKFVGIIGELLSYSAAVGQDGNLVINTDPQACVTFSFASDLGYYFVKLNQCLPPNLIQIYMACLANSYSSSAVYLIEEIIKNSPADYIAFILPYLNFCLNGIEEYFSEHTESMVHEDPIDLLIQTSRLSLIKFLSQYQYDQFPTERVIDVLRICCASSLFTGDEDYFTYVPKITQAIIKANQPSYLLALDFILELALEENQYFENFIEEIASYPLSQSFVSIPAEFLSGYLPQIYQIVISLIVNNVFPQITNFVGDAHEGALLSYFIDFASIFDLLARYIQLTSQDITPETINQLLGILQTFWAFQFDPQTHAPLRIQRHVLLIFFAVLASLCLCKSFNVEFVIQFWPVWYQLIIDGYIDGLYYRRLHYSALLILRNTQGFEEMAAQFDHSMRTLIENKYSGKREVIDFLEKYEYFSIEKIALAPVELNPELPTFLEPEEEESEQEE